MIDDLLGLILNIFPSFAMKINWAKGKSEAILKYRGKGAAAALDKRRHADQIMVALPASADKTHVHVVPAYKHLGSFVSADGSVMADARHRTQVANNAYAPLVGKVFGASLLEQILQSNFAESLVFTRLFYNVHLWSDLQPKAMKHVNTMYMRVLRMIAGDPRFDKNARRDICIRVELGAPSLESLLRMKRLLYASRLAKNGPESLKKLLQTQPHAQQLPWMQLLSCDLRFMHQSLAAKLEAMPDPALDAAAWVQLMVEYPCEWKCLVKQMSSPESTYDQRTAVCVSPGPLDGFACHLCTVNPPCFPSVRALKSHKRAIHKVRNQFRTYVDESEHCPVCQTYLHTRLRVIAHLSDPRRNLTCREAILQGRATALAPDLVQRLDAIDAKARKDAQRMGKSHPLAVGSALKACGTKCGRPASH